MRMLFDTLPTAGCPAYIAATQCAAVWRYQQEHEIPPLSKHNKKQKQGQPPLNGWLRQTSLRLDARCNSSFLQIHSLEARSFHMEE